MRASIPASGSLRRHGRACPGHPRLLIPMVESKTWMPGTRPGMTGERTMRANSLALRLFFSATTWIVVILVVAGIVLSGVYRSAVERAFDRRLQVYLRTLVADVATPDESVERFPQSLSEPLFELPLSGWYWQVTRLDTARPGAALLALAVGFHARPSRRSRRHHLAGRRPPGLYRRPRGPAPARGRAHDRSRRRGPLRRDGRRRRRRDRRGDAHLRPRAGRDLHGAGDRAAADHDLPGPLRPGAAQAHLRRAWPRSARAGRNGSKAASRSRSRRWCAKPTR